MGGGRYWVLGIGRWKVGGEVVGGGWWWEVVGGGWWEVVVGGRTNK